MTKDILKQINHDYLSDYTKLEYVLVSYFRKIQIVQNFEDVIEQHQRLMKSKSTRTSKHLLHIIDLNQAPKFFSDHAFKRFRFSEQNQSNEDIEELKDLVLLDLKKHVTFFTKSSNVYLTIFLT